MLSHSRIWSAIDQLAMRYGMTPSGLARRAGLDPTTFNRSKRVTVEGRNRWPSTESIAKILDATGAGLDDFMAMVRGVPDVGRRSGVPVVGFAQAGGGGFALDIGQGADEIDFPGTVGETSFALKVRGDSMLPLYRNGDTIIVSREVPCRKGDRVVVRTRGGEVMAKVLAKKTVRALDLASLNPDHPNRTLNAAEVDWVGRIIWASQ